MLGCRQLDWYSGWEWINDHIALRGDNIFVDEFCYCGGEPRRSSKAEHPVPAHALASTQSLDLRGRPANWATP